METNLAYAGGGDNRFGDVMTGLINSTASSDTATHFGRPTGANPTAFPIQPSTQKTTGVGQHGYLYNWCAAMGGQAAACQGTQELQPNQSVNPGNGTIFNVCPRGWRLPTGGWQGPPELTLLHTALGGNGPAGNLDQNLRTNGLFMRSGQFAGGTNSFNNVGTSGGLWASTTIGSDAAAAFRFSSTSAIPDMDDPKSWGYSVRCVAP